MYGLLSIALRWQSAIVGASLLLAGSWIYSAFFHPLSKFPGPKAWAASRIPFVLSMVGGRLPHRVRQLHGKYGPIVRVAPDELSFIDAAAWNDIYNNPGYIRPWIWRGQPPGAPGDSLISATEVDHARFRKILSPGLSQKAVWLQQPIINSYVDMLMTKLKRKVDIAESRTAIVDVVEWFNYTSFDIIGDLGWGSSFDCLKTQKINGWIQVVMHLKAVVFAVSFKFFPPLDSLIDAITPKAALAPILGVVRTAQEKVSERLQAKTSRPDIMGLIESLKDKDTDLSMTRGELEMNAFIIISAGSESVTTILSAIVNKLLIYPDAMQKLIHEIRKTFHSDEAIDGVSTAKLDYLNAVIKEGMRLTPSIPDGSRRIIPKHANHAIIAGNPVPGGTTVSIPMWAAYTSARNFAKPTTFAPERWLPGVAASSSDSPYRHDNRQIFHPFGVGAHDCLGQPLAWHELRVILARFLWNFDIAQPNDGDGDGDGDGDDTRTSRPVVWENQKVYWTWEKVPIRVRLSLAEHATQATSTTNTNNGIQTRARARAKAQAKATV